MIHPIQMEIRSKEDKKRGRFLGGFFKTGKGQYAEGDIFLGLTVPQTRLLVKKHLPELSLETVREIIKSKYHEERLAALIALVSMVRKDKKLLDDAATLYLENIKYINNWDLVDTSAEHIIGQYVEKNNKMSLLKKLALSPSLWERRVAMVSTFYFIKRESNKEAYEVASLLLGDDHDLMHKAVGWMLRETGKRVNREELITFLNKNISKIRPTALRYAIEHLSKDERMHYLELRRLSAQAEKIKALRSDTLK